MSANSANYFLKLITASDLISLAVSSFQKRMFSNINIYPSFPFTTIYLASSIVGINYTCLFIIFSKASATGFIENSYSKPFPDGLPK